MALAHHAYAECRYSDQPFDKCVVAHQNDAPFSKRCRKATSLLLVPNVEAVTVQHGGRHFTDRLDEVARELSKHERPGHRRRVAVSMTR